MAVSARGIVDQAQLDKAVGQGLVDGGELTGANLAAQQRRLLDARLDVRSRQGGGAFLDAVL